MMTRRWMTGLLALAIAAGACLGDEPKAPAKFYKLEFVVKEAAGAKVLNSRTYSTIVSGPGKQEIRAGSKVPFAVSPNQYQQIDVGVNVDVFSISEVQDRLTFTVVAEVTSVAEAAGDTTHPTIRQNKWNSTVVIPLRKATQIFSSDNVDAKSQMQIEVTATPIP